MASSCSNYFKDWHYHAQITPSYFLVWSLSKLCDFCAMCYPMFDIATVDHWYKKYGGITCYVFWPNEEPPSLKDIITDSDASQGCVGCQEACATISWW